ncbi:hypothetical protein Trydic_g23604 [Trypoxylus dichotomus]
MVNTKGYQQQCIDLKGSLLETRPKYRKRHPEVISVHDIAPSPTAKSVRNMLEAPHAAYLPDLGPFDYHLFASMAHELAEQRFSAYEDVDKLFDERSIMNQWPNTFEDAELEAVLDEDPCQTQQELSSVLGVTRQVISTRLHALGMNQRQVTGVRYDLKPRNVKRRFLAWEQLLQRQAPAAKKERFSLSPRGG